MSGLSDSGGEVTGSVAGAVIGHDRLDLEAGIGEELASTNPERGRGLFALIRKFFGIGQPCASIDGVMQERVAAR
ncbi:hypothetical protein BJ959_000933 [Chryseoglobus frigidaquae]|uniref:Uncharacterized protein n=1 Tax=Microcella frigidaquae TaxID=424758 RepID=A0A840XKQ7_9MICO|nr:hypothetical protein [Microcella frigidaquae]